MPGRPSGHPARSAAGRCSRNGAEQAVTHQSLVVAPTSTEDPGLSARHYRWRAPVTHLETKSARRRRAQFSQRSWPTRSRYHAIAFSPRPTLTITSWLASAAACASLPQTGNQPAAKKAKRAIITCLS